MDSIFITQFESRFKKLARDKHIATTLRSDMLKADEELCVVLSHCFERLASNKRPTAHRMTSGNLERGNLGNSRSNFFMERT